MMKRILCAVAITAASATAVHAGGVTVFQDGKKFSEAEVTIKPGDTVTYTNKDPYTHNVFSKTPGMAFDLRTQRSGESTSIQFDNAGEADVQCAIHPQMKMKVKVVAP